MTVRVGAVVEGYGEVEALPVLVRRIANDHGIYGVKVFRPHRISRGDMMGSKVSAAVRMQRDRLCADGVVIVVYDADDDDPENARSSTIRALGGQKAVVAVAVREYEAWFLAALDSLREHESVKDDACFVGNPEMPRNAKKRLEEMMTESYKETLHQAKFSAVMSLSAARDRSPSFAAFECDLVAALQSV